MAGKPGRIKWVLAGKIFGGVLVFSALFLIFFPILFHNYIAEKVTDVTSDYLTTELRFKDTRATFFRHFPSLTLSMEDAEIEDISIFEQRMDSLYFRQKDKVGDSLGTLKVAPDTRVNRP